MEKTHKIVTYNVLRMSQKFLIIFLGYFLYGCCSPKETVVFFESFPKSDSLKSEKVEWIDNYKVEDIKIVDSLLILVDSKNKKYIYVYNLTNHKLISSLGRKGKGPEEFVRAPLLSNYCGSNEDFILPIFDQTKRILYKLKMSNDGFFLSNEVKLPKDLYPADWTYFGNGNICSTDSNCFYSYNYISKNYFRKRSPDVTKQKLNENELATVNYMHLQVAQDGNVIVGTYAALQRFNIYNGKGDLKISVANNIVPRFNPSDGYFWEKNKSFYFRSILTKNYILIINEDRFLREMNNSKLLVFDYSGKAIAEYNLDCIIRNGVYDQNAHRLYAFDLSNYRTVFFELPL